LDAAILDMSYYAQPAAANYNTAPLHGYRICDQCGTVETPAVKFRLCGGCVRSLNSLHTFCN
jgi:ribosomal protein S14